jgi:hypothetical protein
MEVTKKDFEDFKELVIEKLREKQLTEVEERQMSMELIKQNARRRNLSIPEYLELEGLGRYQIINKSNERLVYDEDEVYKEKIVKSKYIPVKIGFGEVSKYEDF